LDNKLVDLHFLVQRAVIEVFTIVRNWIKSNRKSLPTAIKNSLETSELQLSELESRLSNNKKKGIEMMKVLRRSFEDIFNDNVENVLDSVGHSSKSGVDRDAKNALLRSSISNKRTKTREAGSGVRFRDQDAGMFTVKKKKKLYYLADDDAHHSNLSSKSEATHKRKNYHYQSSSDEEGGNEQYVIRRRQKRIDGYQFSGLNNRDATLRYFAGSGSEDENVERPANKKKKTVQSNKAFLRDLLRRIKPQVHQAVEIRDAPGEYLFEFQYFVC